MNLHNLLIKSILIIVGLLFLTNAQALKVNITKEIDSVTVNHNGKSITVQRNQDNNATIDPAYAKTSRNCPPFCAQPMSAAEGVRTVGEVEVVSFMGQSLQDGSGFIVDARTPDWFKKGTIPGSINVPFTLLDTRFGANELTIEETLELFGAVNNDEQWDFFEAKTLLLWCNGPWCGQSPAAIRALLKLGYPEEKLLYYRGGMQTWKIFGLTTVIPE